MIELPPPKRLREISSSLILEDEEMHQYRNRFGEEEYRTAIQHFLQQHYGISVKTESILATSGVSALQL
jgi:aspartate/methionine/tyrosine aminotransferase